MTGNPAKLAPQEAPGRRSCLIYVKCLLPVR